MTTKLTSDARYHADAIAEALRVFITSGSANGNESIRDWMLERVDLFATAPGLLAACEAAGAELDNIYQNRCRCDISLNSINGVLAAAKGCRAAIAAVKGGGA